jgi:uncharacterized protein
MSAAAAIALTLDHIEEFPRSDLTYEGRAMLSQLDGFLTAIAIGPEPIPPSEGLEAFFGNDALDSISEEQNELLLEIMLDRYNTILLALENYPEAYEPDIFVDPVTGESTVEDWASGFLDGAHLRWRAWRPLMTADEQIYLALVMLFLRNSDGTYVIKREHDHEVDQIRANAAPRVRDGVLGIYRFFKERRLYFEGATKLGRNEPCFCGSGKKFKKCCGAGR